MEMSLGWLSHRTMSGERPTATEIGFRPTSRTINDQ